MAALQESLGCLDLSQKRSVLQLLLDIEAAGGVRRPFGILRPWILVRDLDRSAYYAIYR